MDPKAEYTQDSSVDFRGRPGIPSRTGKWKACSFLVGYEAFERMAFCGVASNFINYLTTQLHEDTVSSVRNVNNWSGSVWITPILGAYIADSYLGRFWTSTVSSLVYVLGMTLLTSSFTQEPEANMRQWHLQQGFHISNFIFLHSALHYSNWGWWYKAQYLNFLVPINLMISTPMRKRSRPFFNWWLFTSFLGALIATLGLVYIQENLGWGLGYGIPTAGLLLSLVIFYIGTPIYRHKVRKTKSPARDLIRVPIAALKNRAQPPY